MLLAEMLITESGLSMKAIAAKVGYNNLSNFVTAFRAKFGVSPKRFRHHKF
jgi:AraC-like DNA-binding protein